VYLPLVADTSASSGQKGRVGAVSQLHLMRESLPKRTGIRVEMNGARVRATFNKRDSVKFGRAKGRYGA